MSTSEQFLINRPDDLVVIGVQLSGFRMVPPTGNAPPSMEALSDEARIVLSFPPQAIVEEKYEFNENSVLLGEDFTLRGARLAGVSRVTFALPAGTQIPLNAQGILAELARSGTLPSAEDDGTAIELPWHLISSVRARNGEDVVPTLAPLPVTSDAGITGLWHLRLHARTTGPEDAGLALQPLHLEADEPGLDTAPLSAADRQAIISLSVNQLPEVRRLELSALGGSLSARLVLPTFEWEHDAVLSRDHKVLVATEGVLYPFGHRAKYSVTVERIFDSTGTQAVAGLRRRQQLIIKEPVRTYSDEDASLVRQFPFQQVQILTESVTNLEFPQQNQAPSDWQIYRWVPLFPDQLIDMLSALRENLQRLTDEVNQRLAELPQTIQQMFDTGFGSVPDLQQAQQNLAEAPNPQALIELQKQIDRAIDRTDPSDQAAIDELLAQRPTNQDIQSALANWPALNAEVVRLQAAVNAEFAALPRSIEQLAGAGDEQANQVLAQRAEITQLEVVIEQINASAQELHNLFFMPHTTDGEPLQFSLRCAGANGDVYFTTPLIFIRDFHFDATEHFPAFASLTDNQVADRLAAAWAAPTGSPPAPPERVAPVATAVGTIGRALHQAARQLPLPGLPIDLLRSVNRLASDVHEVHELSIAAIPHAGRFWPSVTQFGVELPTLRALLPAQSKRVALTYTEEFLRDGDQVDVALKLVDHALVDFTQRADRSGGLVAPKFAADGISRTLGLVPTGALPGVGLPDLSTVYAGATLLGFPLGAIIDLSSVSGLPLPPAIVPVLTPGQAPGVRMSWHKLPLKSLGPLKADETTLDLDVEASPLKTQTTCTVANLRLELPPTEAKVLTLAFKSVVFSQQLGQAPDLKINGLDITFEGPLKLLAGLRDKLQEFIGLGDRGPLVRTTSNGITASYSLSVPDLSMGGFLLRNIAISTTVDVPFDGKPVTVSLSFARRDNPFNLSVLMFGGGGYLDLQVGPTGLMRLEASMEFGAAVAIDFLVASGEVHAFGGLRYLQRGGAIELDGFLRFGGSIEVLGLISVSVELVIALLYDAQDDKLWGRATLVIEIDLTLYATSVELDSGEWVLHNGPDQQNSSPSLDASTRRLARTDDADLQAWWAYQEAFAI